ncbi:protein lethal(2)essential for life-like [Pectinophora gossypiella]|uniref:protein lethal(2)essential for life-like n=1 Tax=Pectinophora gossypiella TaxID=13191 RepID=UPI00214F29C7|nr:protein lethal(2)essential for life-like [Pectinophora gossypiella]
MSLWSIYPNEDDPTLEPEELKDTEADASNVSGISMPLLGVSKSSILSSGLGQISNVNIDSETYRLNLDVRQFSPEEISVKTIDGFLVIEAGHVDELEENASVTRRFAARYALPAGCNTDGLTSFVNSDGMLTITAPLDVTHAAATISLIESAAMLSEVKAIQSATGSQSEAKNSKDQPPAKSSQTSKDVDQPDSMLSILAATSM